MTRSIIFLYRESVNNLRHAFSLAVLIALQVLVVPPFLAQEQPPPLTNPPTYAGSVHGIVVADVPAPDGRGTIPLPNAEVTLRSASGSTLGRSAATLTGRFTTALQRAGTYRVCSRAPGFSEACSDPVTISNDSVSLRESLALKPQGGILHGHVSLEDGSPAVRLEAASEGNTAAVAQVSLANSGGRIIAGPVSVNAGSDYVLAPVSAGSNLVLSVRYEGNSTTKTITLDQEGLDSGKAVDVALPGAAPKVAEVSMTLDGKPVTSAPLGSTVLITVKVEDASAGTLHYRWTSNSVGLVAKDAPSVTITLPKAAATTVVFVEITNGQGGVTGGSITIPLLAAPGAERGLVLSHNTRKFLRPINNLNLPPASNYSIPPHKGLFIDPTLLMGGACNSENTCETEATAYYKAIGALDSNGNPTATGTFKGWKTTFGFSADPTTPSSGELRATYYNNGDLKFGRDMHCRMFSSFLFDRVACYVSNYGDGQHTFGSDPQIAINNAHANTGRIATVAMVYGVQKVFVCTPIRCSPPPRVYRVQFYVFNFNQNDVNDGSLLNAAILDSGPPPANPAKAVPGICLTCHGGQYDPTVHLAQNSNFLPFDAPSFVFSTSNTDLLESSQREAIRQLNGAVRLATYARLTIAQLIEGWYQWCGGVGTTNCYIDDVGHPFYPNQQACPSGDQSGISCGWPATWGGALAQSFYQRVPRAYCRTCHVAQANFLNINSFTDWTAQAGLIKQFVLASQASTPGPNFMPLAEVPYDAFWLDFQAQSAMTAFLNATGP